jgi:hypothetical protein
MRAPSRKVGQLHLPAATAASLRQQRLHHPNQQQIDTFPFSNSGSAERMKQLIERKRLETAGLRRSKVRTSAANAGSSVALEGAFHDLRAAQTTQTSLQRAFLTGVVQDLNRLSHQKKVTALVALKRRFVLPNQKLVTRKLKQNQGLMRTPRSLVALFGHV